jgi:RNA polymerase sigma factor (sigma-70 family)
LTDKELMQYRKLAMEANDLQNRIDRLYDKTIDTAHSTVRGSTKFFPYIEFHMGIWVDDPRQVADRDKLIAVYQERLDQARKEIIRIEQFIQSIKDSELRQIFVYRYVDGMSQIIIGEKLNLDRSVISRRISKYISNLENAGL